MASLQEQLAAAQARIAELEAAKVRKPVGITCKVSQKGAVSVYGLQRFPITLYASQWERFLSEGVDKVKACIADNRDKLATKAG
jgi:hypothetical protein